MLSILLFIARRKLEFREPLLNFEVQDSGNRTSADPPAKGAKLESVISKFRIGPRISNFHTWFSTEIILWLTAMGAGVGTFLGRGARWNIRQNLLNRYFYEPETVMKMGR